MVCCQNSVDIKPLRKRNIILNNYIQNIIECMLKQINIVKISVDLRRIPVFFTILQVTIHQRMIVRRYAGVFRIHQVSISFDVVLAAAIHTHLPI